MRPRVIFLDDGGVLSDNARRAREWQRLIGEFLVPRLGGRHTAWEEANHVVFERQWQRFLDWERELSSAGEYGDFFGSLGERERWLREMCEHVNVDPPPWEDCVRLAFDTEEYVMPRIRAAFPDAVDAVNVLAALGYTLASASGESSRELEHYLAGMGVRSLFSQYLFGPDLVRTLKGSCRYYERIFAYAGIDAEDALVIDDSPSAVTWALEAGARAVLVKRDGALRGDIAAPAIPSLAELPSLLSSMD